MDTLTILERRDGVLMKSLVLQYKVCLGLGDMSILLSAKLLQAKRKPKEGDILQICTR